MKTSVLVPIAVLLFVCVVLGHPPAPAAPMSITVERTRALRCGAPSADNVCVSDDVTVAAPRASVLALYRTDLVEQRNRLELACPGDPRCYRVGRGWGFVWRAAHAGNAQVLASDHPVTLGATYEDSALAINRSGGPLEYQWLEVRP